MGDDEAIQTDTEQALRGLAGARALGGFRWFPDASAWALELELRAPPGGCVPALTRWFLVRRSPRGEGEVELHPAAWTGLPRTFPHQAWSARSKGDVPWMSGAICPRSSAGAARLLGSDEPQAFPERAVWLVEAGLRWLHAAAMGELTPAGADLELPPLPPTDDFVLAFHEGVADLDRWRARVGRHGRAEVATVNPRGLAVVRGWSGPDGLADPPIPWGSALMGLATQRIERALWIALPALPIEAPWHIPATWGALRRILLKATGAPLEQLVAAQIQAREPPAWLLLGAALPAKIGGPLTRWSWLAVRLPALDAHPRGYRSLRASLALALRDGPLADGASVGWVQTQNWHPEALRARGHHPALAPRAALLLGVGALGSALADLLLRGGLSRCVLYDGDTLAVGNLCRHTAFFTEVGTRKASTMGVRLSLTQPHAQVRVHARSFPPENGDDLREALACDLVIDATADDRALNAVAALDWGPETLFVSAWLGYGGERAYVFTARGPRFPLDDWRAAVEPWLRVERQIIDALGLPREGLGCWSEVFPAHAEDVWQAAGQTVRGLVRALEGGPMGLTVYQQEVDSDVAPGLRRLLSPADIRWPRVEGP